MRSRSHTHNFRLGADYDIGKDHALSFVYNGAYATSHTRQHTTGTHDGAYATSHTRQHTTGTQTATNLSTQTSWLHNGRLDYEAPIGLKAGAEFTWYQAPGDQLLHSEMEGARMDFYTTDKQRINAWSPRRPAPPQRDGGRPHGLLHHGQAAHQCLEVLPCARTCAEERMGTELRGHIHHERGQLVPVLL